MATHVILLVDDNIDDVTLTLRALDKCNLDADIVVARDGMEALDLLLPTDGSVPLRPKMVLLDINMPRMSGLELLQFLRSDSSTKSIPVIMLTSSGEDRDLIESYQHGANSYVQKPVDTIEFLEAAKVLGVYWLWVNRQPSLESHRYS